MNLKTTWLLIFLTIPLQGCGSLSYYFEQSIPGHLSLMFKMKEIDTLILQDIEPKLKHKLQTVLEIRKYASDKLNLPENESYTYYADIKRPYVTWNITAAPEFSLLPKKWCYFVIGCASYRGYYNEHDAQEYAKKVEAEGYDVAIGGATAYSTLGFFNDPVLSTMIPWQDYQLAGIIFHELSHQLLYIKSDTAFNEAFAKTVEIVGIIQWLHENEPKKIPDFLAALKRAEEFRRLILDTREQLQTLYKEDKSDQEKRELKTQIFDQMKQRHQDLTRVWGHDYYQRWFDRPLNNARMISQMTYWQWVPSFLALFIEADMNWEDFYAKVKAVSKQDAPQRQKTLEALLQRKIDLPYVLERITGA